MSAAVVDALARQAIGDLKAAYADAWLRWSDAEKDLVERSVKDAADLTVRALAGEDVSREKKFVDATLANLKVAATATASQAIWHVLSKLLVKAAELILV
jgi:hypothetical protein